MRSLLSTVALGTLLAALPAQTHTSTIQQNPDGTTRMTFEVRGPAFGVGIVFGSTRITNGIPLPPYGTLYLDPATGLVNLFAIPIGPSGVGSLSIAMPTLALDGLMLATQAAVFSAGRVTLTNWSAIGLLVTPNDLPNAGTAAAYDADTDVLQVWVYGPPGTRVQIWEKEGTHVVRLRDVQIQPDGCSMQTIQNVDLRQGDEIVVDVGNKTYTFCW